MPRRVTTVLGGEGLVEGTAQLTLYLAFSAAITAGAFSFFDVARALVVGPIIGAAVGLAMAWLVYQVDLRMPDPSLSITLSLLAPFAAYLPALAVGGNRLAAVAVAGLYLGWRADVTESPAVRLNADAAWLVLAFLLNGFIYVPAGMALPGVLRDLGGVSYAALLGWVLALTLAVLATRFLWVLGVHTLVRVVRGLLGRRTDVAWSERILFAYAPTRGAFAVASALALPLSAGAGEPFPARDLLIALSVGVMLVSDAARLDPGHRPARGPRPRTRREPGLAEGCRGSARTHRRARRRPAGAGGTRQRLAPPVPGSPATLRERPGRPSSRDGARHRRPQGPNRGRARSPLAPPRGRRHKRHGLSPRRARARHHGTVSRLLTSSRSALGFILKTAIGPGCIRICRGRSEERRVFQKGALQHRLALPRSTALILGALGRILSVFITVSLLNRRQAGSVPQVVWHK